MHVVFVHGWSVTNTDTYGDLPGWLARQSRGFKVHDVFLGKYVSFADTVTVDDIARAFQRALEDALGAQKMREGFACITHSTGGPVVRLWMKLFHDGDLAGCPMKHLVMLAPANHGSALAQLGKGVLGRLKSMVEGVEPGIRVLDWLELGSEASWRLNESWLYYDCAAASVYPFVLTGQSIDRSLYDHLNSYTGEPGSDGVVRACAANMNYALAGLAQSGGTLEADFSRRSPRSAFGVLPGLAHSGDRMGIIRSVTLARATSHPTAHWVLRCLQVASREQYDALCDELDAVTARTQREERIEKEEKFFGIRTYRTSRYSMLVFRFVDDRGDVLSDYDLFITGGPDYSPDDLPEGFFVDRQRNRRNPGRLTYYVDYDAMRRGLGKVAMQGRLGFRVVARPQQDDEALAYYRPLEFRSDAHAVAEILRPNETLMVQVRLQRVVDRRVFRIEHGLAPSSIERKPTGRVV